jgi:hypothetical protein
MGPLDDDGWTGIVVAVLAGMIMVVLSLAALLQIRRAAHLCQTVRTNWVLAVLLAPLFGATAWFAIGSRIRLDQG